MKKLLCIILSVSMLFCIPAVASAQTNTLQFTDGEFTILQISDPQDDRYAAYDLINFVKLALEETKPDLVILSGDIVEDNRAGDFGIDDENFREGVEVDTYEETLDNVKVATNNIFSIINDAKIPFAVALFGLRLAFHHSKPLFFSQKSLKNIGKPLKNGVKYTIISFELFCYNDL